MKKGSLYFKLAFQNIKSNRKFYIPYMIAGAVTSMLMYILFYLIRDDKLSSEYSGSTELVLIEFLTVGIVIATIFSAIIIFYTNSFLMKRRKKEIGLYNILGMEKRHLAGVQFIETFTIAICSVICGFIFGITFSKLVLLLLCKITGLSAPFGFHVDFFAMGITTIIFACIYALVLLYNLVQVGKAKPVDLLRSENVGQKPPKAKWVITIIGILTLGLGYIMALTTQDALTAIILFLLAVILVIVGTYCLFTSGSISVLKLMQKSKKFYYKTSHFTGVSGMLYRMKANAVGLSNICILSTMVLVTVSTTVALNVGMADSVSSTYPYSAKVSIRCSDTKKALDEISEFTNDYAKKNKFSVTFDKRYTNVSIAAQKNGNDISFENPKNEMSSNLIMLAVMPLSSYNEFNTQSVSLAPHEVLAQYIDGEKTDGFILNGEKYSVKKNIDNYPDSAEYQPYAYPVTMIVVNDDEFTHITEQQQKAYGKYSSTDWYTVCFNFSDNATVKQQLDYQSAVRTKIDSMAQTYSEQNESDGLSYTTTIRESARESMYAMYGGFLFLGIFFGTLFTLATVLIIYYKQLSEGYDDRQRYQIMQKVGLSHAETRKTIRSQVLTVFFLPLAVAVIHLAVAFKMIAKLLSLLNLTNLSLYVISAVITVIVFAVIYAIVYMITARSYYKIVSK